MSDSKTRIDVEKIISLCKRRGIIFQNSEIYGGLASTWDYGPLGVELKRNVKDCWWRSMVWNRDDIVGLDSSILMHSDAWKASGHIDNFTDPLVDCKDCRQRWREDQLSENLCPDCGGALTESRNFNLMFKTHMGPVEGDATAVYLRPETAQGIFVNFSNVLTTTRKKLPFGIAQIGKAFRNEITTGNFIFRTREFEMMELEFFVSPGDDDHWHRYWINESVRWYIELGVNPDSLRTVAHSPEQLSHYSKATSDIEYEFPWGWGEIAGIANRTDYDIKAHSLASGHEMSYFDGKSDKHIMPYVLEPSFGVDRAVMAFLADAYTEEEVSTGSGNTEQRVVLKLHPRLAPVKVAVLPLSRNERLAPLANEVYKIVHQSQDVQGVVQFDDTQSIGKRYRRQDEIGTPLCITVDFDSIDDRAVTIRERDTMLQDRVPITELTDHVKTRLSNGSE